MADLAEIRGLSVEELREKAVQLKKQLMKYRFEKQMNKLEKHSALREVRREIARVLTVIREKKTEVAS